MYGRFAIDNFRGVEHIDLDRMSPDNLLVGDNGSGQATMLEALRLHAATWTCCLSISPSPTLRWLAPVTKVTFSGIMRRRG